MIIVKPDVAYQHETLVALNANGEPVELNGKGLEVEVEATPQRPKHIRKVRAATQAELEWLYKQGNPLLMQVETPAKAETKADKA